jgi:hypothetical protein
MSNTAVRAVGDLLSAVAVGIVTVFVIVLLVFGIHALLSLRRL